MGLSGFWHNALKKIIFKNLYEQIDKNAQLFTTATENNKKNSQSMSEILENSKKDSIEIMRQNEIQNTQQHEKFIQEVKKYLSEQINNQI